MRIRFLQSVGIINADGNLRSYQRDDVRTWDDEAQAAALVAARIAVKLDEDDEPIWT